MAKQNSALGALAEMAGADQNQTDEKDKRSRIRPGTPEMEAYLGVGYGGMKVDEAETIVAQWEKDPTRWPLDEVRKAQAFLAAYRATPQVIDKTPGKTQSNPEGKKK